MAIHKEERYLPISLHSSRDFALKHKFGNLLKQSYSEIAQSKALNLIRRNRFSWDGNVLCRSYMSSGRQFIVLLMVKEVYCKFADR